MHHLEFCLDHHGNKLDSCVTIAQHVDRNYSALLDKLYCHILMKSEQS